MGIPIPNRESHSPRAALVALVAVGALLILAAGPVAFWAAQQMRGSGSSNPPPVAQVSPSPSPLQTPSPTPSPLTSPSPVSVIATLHGKIAISSGQPGSGGWIQFPGGSFTADPKSNVTLPGGGWGNGLAWNAAAKSWVAVNWYMIRQDGQIYVYPYYDGNGQAVMAVRLNGTSYSLAPLPQNSYSYNVLSAEPEGVYVSSMQGQGGLWLLGYSGGIRQIYASGFWTHAAFGYAYGTITPYVPQGGTNVIRRLNLKTGVAVDWFTQPGMESRVVGVTVNGTAIIEARSSATVEVWLGTQAPKLLHSENVVPTTGMGGMPSGYVLSALGDQVGIWVAESHGLYLYTDKAGWEFASPTTGMLGSTIQ